jgi:O-antigen ligase
MSANESISIPRDAGAQSALLLRTADIVCTIYVALAVVLLVLPYTTGALVYGFNIAGIFPIRPMKYMIMASAFLAGSVILRRPRLYPGMIWLFLLMSWRWFDALLFHRVEGLTYSPVLSAGGPLCFFLALWVASGNRRGMRWGVLISGILTIVIVAGFDIYEWRNPGAFSVVPGRSAGMLANPNDSAQAIVLMLGLLGSMLLRPGLTIPLTIVGGFGVFFTLSRSGWSLFAVFLVSYGAAIFKSGRRLIISTIAIAVITIAIAANFISTGSNSTDSNVTERLAMLRTGEVANPDDTGRLTLLVSGLEAFTKKPFTGYGTMASAELISPHNIYVATALDSGIVGLLFYSFGLLALGRKAWRTNKNQFILLFQLVLTGIFSHNLLENNSFLLCWFVCASELKGAAYPLTVKSFFAFAEREDQLVRAA